MTQISCFVEPRKVWNLHLKEKRGQGHQQNVTFEQILTLVYILI